MPRCSSCLTLFALVVFAAPARAGLYYSGETYAALPSQWRGFLMDQRSLRNIAGAPPKGQDAGPLRSRYQNEAARLQKRLNAERQLPADEWADLGAIYVRLGEPGRAVELLRVAHRNHPNHFAIAANLGTASQLVGDLAQAALALQHAVHLAPGKVLQAEELHLKLVRLRLKQGKASADLDDLFGVRYVGPRGEFEPGRLADDQRKKLPARAVALTQQLALWLPADGRLLWQLAELANAHGDLVSAAAMFDGCVLQFGMTSPEVRRRRLLLRDAADSLAKSGPATFDHTKHGGGLAFRSARPLTTKLDAASLPPISAAGVNPVPWELFGETTVGKPFRPVFADYLRQLDGKQVALTGFMYPLREDPEATAFMFIENPVGCWYCEQPDMTAIVLIEMPDGKSFHFTRGQIHVRGKLVLNASDPENFLYTIRDAQVESKD